MFSILAITVCWVSCVRGVTAQQSVWALFIFMGVLDLAWNVWGAFKAWEGALSQCALSSPVVTGTANVCIFISMWFTFLILAACVRYCLTARSTRDKAKFIVSKKFEDFESKMEFDIDGSASENEIETRANSEVSKSLLSSVPTAMGADAVSDSIATAVNTMEISTKPGKEIDADDKKGK